MMNFFTKKSAHFFAILLSAIFFTSCLTTPQNARLMGEDEVRLRNSAIDALEDGNNFFAQKKYAHAINSYQKVFNYAEHVENAIIDTAMYQLACSYTMIKDFKNAKEYFAKLFDAKSQSRVLKESLAYVTLLGGDVANGTKLYEELASENPFDGKLKNNYILALVASKDLDGAEKELNAYEALYGKDEHFYTITEKIAQQKNPPVETVQKTTDKENFSTDASKEKFDSENELKEENIQKENSSTNNMPPPPVDKSILDDDAFAIPDWTSGF